MVRIKKTIVKLFLWMAGILLFFIAVVLINLIIAGKNEAIVSTGTPIENYGIRHPALLVVDIQEATTGAVSVYPYFKENSAQLVESINQAIDSFHTRNLPVVYVRSEITNPLINLVNSTYAKGSEGAKYDRRLKVVSDLEVVKSVKDSFRKTRLDSILVAHKVNELYIAGLDAAECVNATVEAALNRGYRVIILEEAVISKSATQTDSMMVVFKKRGAGILKMDSLALTK